MIPVTGPRPARLTCIADSRPRRGGDLEGVLDEEASGPGAALSWLRSGRQSRLRLGEHPGPRANVEPVGGGQLPHRSWRKHRPDRPGPLQPPADPLIRGIPDLAEVP